MYTLFCLVQNNCIAMEVLLDGVFEVEEVAQAVRVAASSKRKTNMVKQ